MEKEFEIEMEIEKRSAGAVLMDLSKVFDTTNYELLIDAYAFDNNALELIYSYLKNRK